MSTYTAHTYTHTDPRPTAGQYGRADSRIVKKGKHSLESLIGDIDSYIAEQEAYERESWDEERLETIGPAPARPRSDSRGTMFVDMNELGEMMVSWRHQVRSHRVSEPLPDRNDGSELLPDGDLYVIDDYGDERREMGDAPRYISTPDGVRYIRVGVTAAEKGIYVLRRDNGMYEGEERRSATGNTTQHHHQKRRTPNAPRRPQRTSLPAEFYAGGTEGEYPRPMRRVDKPLPRVPRGGQRKRRSFVEVIKGVMRKIYAAHDTRPQSAPVAHYGSRQRHAYGNAVRRSFYA